MKFNLKILSLLVFIGFGSTQCVSVLGSSENDTETKALSKEDKLRDEIISYAKKQLGTSYQYAGRDPRGFDCSGYTYYVMKEFGVKLSTSSKAQANEGKKVDVKEVKPGDLIFFKRTRAGRVFHVAMVVSNTSSGLEVIHSTSRGVVVDNITKSKYWKPKISSARNVVDAVL